MLLSVKVIIAAGGMLAKSVAHDLGDQYLKSLICGDTTWNF